MVFGVEEASGRQVAAKIELIAGALGRERRALRWLDEKDGLAPRLLASGTVVEGDAHAGALCLVTARVAGGPPTSNEGWERMGQVIARLADVPVRSSYLPTLGHDDFLALHRQRVDELNEALGRDFGAGLPAVPLAYFDSPLVLTHGDPGPGNFIDDGAEGTLVDWEDAQVAPRGLDLGRAIFMALIGSRSVATPASGHQAAAAAVRTGFLAEAEDCSLSEDELAWWLGVAGVQFAQWRLEREGQPGVQPWLDAVTVLEAALHDD